MEGEETAESDPEVKRVKLTIEWVVRTAELLLLTAAFRFAYNQSHSTVLLIITVAMYCAAGVQICMPISQGLALSFAWLLERPSVPSWARGLALGIVAIPLGVGILLLAQTALHGALRELVAAQVVAH